MSRLSPLFCANLSPLVGYLPGISLVKQPKGKAKVSFSTPRQKRWRLKFYTSNPCRLPTPLPPHR